MFTQSADIYDLLYSFKDYQQEAGEIIKMIKSHRPDCKTVLDIGCGTAEHHKFLKSDYRIDGLDINKDFIECAKVKNKDGFYITADMTQFRLDKKYDVIMCLFSSIGYVKTYGHLTRSLENFYTHLHEDGLVIVEPWLTPDKWHNDRLHMLTYDKENIKICRMNISSTEGNLSVLNFHYLLGTPALGVRHFEERHELALFTRLEMKNAFEAAGFETEYEEIGLTGRGLYIGKKNKNAKTRRH